MGELINLNPGAPITDADIPQAIARDTEIAAAIAAHDTADWVHLDFLWRHFVPRDRTNQSPDYTYAMPSELASAIASHVAATDPHPIYLTQVEGDARYRQSATALTLTDADIPAAIARDAEVAAAITAHESARNSHPFYPTFLSGVFSTGASQGSIVSIPHNLALARLLSFSGTVTVNTFNAAGVFPRIAPGGLQGLPGYNYSLHLDESNIICRLSPTDSFNILSARIMVTIFYAP